MVVEGDSDDGWFDRTGKARPGDQRGSRPGPSDRGDAGTTLVTAPRPSSRFAGHTAIVTGASRGIGLAIAQRLVAEGARVVITGRNPDPLAEAVDSLGGSGHAVAVAGHTADGDHQDAVVQTALEHFGSVDLMVNNTGINPVFGPLLKIDPATALKVVDVNCVAALSWVQRAHGAWMGKQGGAVVNIASAAGLRPAEGIGFYGASKAMLSHLTAQLALELGPEIRVNAVAPAVVKTVFAGALYNGKEDEVADRYPLGRLGVPTDISAAVAFLLSRDADWITGQTLVVDGGLLQTGGV